MNKEPLFDSERFKVMLGAVITEVLLFFVAAYSVNIDLADVQGIAMGIAVIVTGFIWGRTKRNVASSDDHAYTRFDLTE